MTVRQIFGNGPSLLVNNMVAQDADSWRCDFHDITWRQPTRWIEPRAGSRWRPGRNQVAGFERCEGCQIGDEIVEPEQQSCCGILLARPLYNDLADKAGEEGAQGSITRIVSLCLGLTTFFAAGE